MQVPPAEESRHCCSHIQRRKGRPIRRKPGRKSPRRLGNWSDPCRGTSKLAGRSKCANRVSHEIVPPRETDCGKIGNAEPLISRRRPCRHRCLELTVSKSPGSVEDGMPGRNGQRKPGTARGSPRRSRTAKAARISRRAVKSRCAREWDGWGRLSDDGSRQHNSIRSEDPWGRWSIPPCGGALSSPQARLWPVPSM